MGYGAKYVTPTIEEGMAELVAAGVDRVVGIVLTPHQSAAGSASTIERAARRGRGWTAPVGAHRGPVVAPGRRASPACWPSGTRAVLD